MASITYYQGPECPKCHLQVLVGIQTLLVRQTSTIPAVRSDTIPIMMTAHFVSHLSSWWENVTLGMTLWRLSFKSPEPCPLHQRISALSSNTSLSSSESSTLVPTTRTTGEGPTLTELKLYGVVPFLITEKERCYCILILICHCHLLPMFQCFGESVQGSPTLWSAHSGRGPVSQRQNFCRLPPCQR
jgi:hypothetical protein